MFAHSNFYFLRYNKEQYMERIVYEEQNKNKN